MYFKKENNMPNNKWNIQLVDAYCLEQSFLRDNIHCEINQEAKTLQFTIERYACDPMGFHVGYERFTGELKMYNRYELGAIGGSPTGLSPHVVIPDILEVVEVVPAEEPIERTRQDAIEYLDEHFGEREKWIREIGDDLDSIYFTDDEILHFAYDNGLGENDYYSPDEDFAYSELENSLQLTINSSNFISPEFDVETRTWSIGYREWKVGE